MRADAKKLAELKCQVNSLEQKSDKLEDSIESNPLNAMAAGMELYTESMQLASEYVTLELQLTQKYMSKGLQDLEEFQKILEDEMKSCD